jgi:hypothetical protein
LHGPASCRVPEPGLSEARAAPLEERDRHTRVSQPAGTQADEVTSRGEQTLAHETLGLTGQGGGLGPMGTQERKAEVDALLP